MEIPIKSPTLGVVTQSIEDATPSMGKKELALQEPPLPIDNTPKGRALIKAGATREVAYNTMVSGLEAESMTVDKFGNEHMTPDHSSRLKAAELISRLNGDLKATEVSIDNRTVNISGVGAEMMGQLVEMVKDVAGQLAALRTSGKQTGEIIDVTGN